MPSQQDDIIVLFCQLMLFDTHWECSPRLMISIVSEDYSNQHGLLNGMGEINIKIYVYYFGYRKGRI